MSSFIFFPCLTKMSYYTSQKKIPNPFSWLSMDTEKRRIFKGFLAFICISRANESTISTLRLLATPTALLCLAVSWGLTTRHSQYKDIREERLFFFTSGHLRARATGSLTNWASNKGLKQPQGLSAPEVSWKAQALMDGVNGETGLLLSNGRPYLWYELRGVCFCSPTAALILWWQLRLKKLFPHLCYHSCISAFILVWAAQSCVNSEEREESRGMFWEKAIGLICGEACFAFFLCPMNSTEATYRKYALVLYHYLKAIYAYRYCI